MNDYAAANGKVRGKLVILVLVAASGVEAQTFEVASLHLHPEPITVSSDPQPHGNRVTATASTLRDMITSAYEIRYDQISGGADWFRTEHYDLAAKAEGDGALSVEQMRPLLQAFLAERFELKVHRETREVPVYALVVDKNGHKLKAVPAESDPGRGSVRAGAAGFHIVEEKGTMALLARRLSGNGAGRPVIDRTGLTGFFSYTLDYANGTPSADSDVPGLVTAIQEQLGLRLESTKGPMEVVVIDHAVKPAAN